MLTPEQVQAFKDALTAACDAQIASGKKIISGKFYWEGDSCPINCYLHAIDSSGRPWSGPLSDQLSTKLAFEISPDETWDFIHTFDAMPGYEADSPLATVGRELRAKYIGTGEAK